METFMILNDVKVTVKNWNTTPTVRLQELMEALGLGDKSCRDMVRHGIPEASIFKIPLGKRINSYYLAREGIEAFVKKYALDNLERVLTLFDATVDIAAEADSKDEDEKHVGVDASDPYAVDLLEDILSRLTAMEQKQEEFQTAFMSLTTRQMIMNLEFETVVNKTLAMISRAEAIGPVARMNKDLSKALNEVGKEALADSRACEDALAEYDNFLENTKDKREPEEKKEPALIVKKMFDKQSQKGTVNTVC